MMPTTTAFRQIADLARSVSSALELETVLREVTAAVLALRSDIRCVIRLVDLEAGGYRLAAVSGAEADGLLPLLPFGEGLTHAVVEGRQPLLVLNALREPRASARAWRPISGLPVYYGVPIEAGETVLGVLSVNLPAGAQPTEEEQEIIAVVAGHAAVAIRNAGLFAASEARRRAAEALANVARNLAQVTDLDLIAQQIADDVRALLDGRSSILFRVETESEDLVALAVSGDIGPTLGANIIFPRGSGVAGLAVQERRPVVTLDILADSRVTLTPAERGRLEHASYRAVLAVPLRIQGRVIGALGVGDRAGRAFRDEEIRLTEAFADHAAVALEKARIYAQAERERRRLQVLYDVTRRLATVHDTDQILGVIVNEATRLLGAEAAGLRLLEGDELVLRARTDSAARLMSRLRLKVGESLSGVAVGTGEPVVVEDLLEETRYDPAHKQAAVELGFHGFVSVPLWTDGRILGALNVYTKRRRRFTPDEIALLSAFADQAALALEKARFLREAKERAAALLRLNTVLEQEIAERQRSEQALARQTEELKRSNAELEQFAYVASHDLQEPLRMITGYTQLLARRYKGNLDADADEFIAYAVDGATRMQRLINDLLTYSRVGTQAKPLEPTDGMEAFAAACGNLHVAIEESGAVVTADPLPTVMADKTQLVQLFQNLIGNALKFRSDLPVKVHVGVARDRMRWRFSVQDNGIGVESQHGERIFLMFQRLHGRTEYPGTGIGLAVCKKIVERHGGRIWVKSQPGEGSTFYFTIPVASAEEPND